MTGTTDSLIEAALAAGRADLAAEVARLESLPTPPGDAASCHATAVAHFAAGRHAEAERELRLALRLAPHAAAWHDHLGVVLASQRRYAEAEATFRIAERLAPGDASPRRNRAQCLLDWQRPADAARAYESLVASHPGDAVAWDRLGVLRSAAGDLAGAAACFGALVRLAPGAAGAWSNLAAALGKSRDWVGAVDAGREATRLAPESSGAWSNLGNALRDLGRADEAVEALHTAARLDATSPDAAGNLALALATRGDHARATPWYDRAVALDPDRAEVRFNRAVCRLALGDFAGGWPEYEWRFGTEQMRNHVPLAGTPWRGEPLAGKSIAVQCEQGHGDTLQFARLATRLSERGAAVTLVAHGSLARLLRTVAGIDRVVTPGERRPATDYVTLLLTLPLLLGLRLESIPRAVPVVSAPAESVAAWRARLAGLPGLKVGVAWQGNPRHVGDRFRSVPLSRFAPLALPGVALVSLQLGPGREQLLTSPLGVLDPFDADPVDFADTAGLVQNLDLVVTVDSAMAHLAGSLARPVWVVVPVNADWRWLTGRGDSPWYPTARLFRQASFGEWGPVFDAVAAALRFLSPRTNGEG